MPGMYMLIALVKSQMEEPKQKPNFIDFMPDSKVRVKRKYKKNGKLKD